MRVCLNRVEREGLWFVSDVSAVRITPIKQQHRKLLHHVTLFSCCALCVVRQRQSMQWMKYATGSCSFYSSKLVVVVVVAFVSNQHS